MPEYTIIVSGPKSVASQAANALAQAGLDVQPQRDHNYGLTDHPSGDEVRQATAFLCVHGDDINAAHSAVEPLGWTLRAHHHKPPDPAPDPMAARLAALEASVAELTQAKGSV